MFCFGGTNVVASNPPCPQCGSTDYVTLFVCDLCKRTVHSNIPDEQAQAEYEKTFGIPFVADEVGKCCDDCWERVKP